jgi:flagellar biosynthesis/type III secretory pathway protein FliH
MTATEISLILGQSAALVTALAAAWASLRNAKKIEASAENVRKIEVATNSMKDALVKATAEANLAKGTAAGLEQGRNEGRPENQR